MLFEGRQRVIIQNVHPEIDAGAFPIKRVIGENIVVRAHVFSDGHDLVSASVLYRTTAEASFHHVPMRLAGNDLWEGHFNVTERTRHVYTVEGWVDHFATWQTDLRKKVAAGQKVEIELLIGAEHIAQAAERADGEDRNRLMSIREKLANPGHIDEAIMVAVGDELTRLMNTYPDRRFSTRYERELTVEVDRRKAGFSSWYEFFPRSSSAEPGAHGSFRDAEMLVPRIARMGFDVLYLPPIHPIGRTNRKGKNNSVAANPDDVGSPWAIGSDEGGHKTVNPRLGTLDDFRHFVASAQQYGLEVALDIAFQCSPDHPYVREHPEWFRWRPDGSIQYAENPPKRYEDIIPFNFETDSWRELWQELRSIFLFWSEQGVHIFRVDNPHTKPFPFWEWVIPEVKTAYPDTIFLSEAFTRPQLMSRLAKVGFTQSYTYFTWRNSKAEVTEYLKDLTTTRLRDYLRPNFWPNTPDILPEFLQYGGRPAFLIRLVLAATLSANYGIYGPAFELCVSEAIEGKEEYRDSEKYELKHWNLDRPGNISALITEINRIRRENEALQQTSDLQFYEVDNEYLLFYGKATDDLANVILVLVNLDPFHKQTGWVKVPLHQLGITADQPYLVHDLVGDDKFIWHGEYNYVELDPRIIPFHIFRVNRRLRREVDFDYYT